MNNSVEQLNTIMKHICYLLSSMSWSSSSYPVIICIWDNDIMLITKNVDT